jgi:phosphopantothenoylcysteine synthetase/decarboxylase
VKILITCGPASEAIDAIRRVTNHSSGALGTALATSLADIGHEVLCMRGSGATAPPPAAPVRVVPFFGNAELEQLLAAEAGKHDVVLHLAALADFLPHEVEADGRTLSAGPEGKIRSDASGLTVRFRRAPKLLAQLRQWFPQSCIVGWKYEVDGDEANLLRLGSRQIMENQLNASVLNGPAMGDGLLLLLSSGKTQSFSSRKEFLQFFPGFLTEIQTR